MITNANDDVFGEHRRESERKVLKGTDWSLLRLRSSGVFAFRNPDSEDLQSINSMEHHRIAPVAFAAANRCLAAAWQFLGKRDTR